MSVSAEPLELELDKNNWILKLINEEFIDPTFNQGILLVNGVSFEVYGSEIWDAYENRAFWGQFPISFWDCFIAPQNGYPSTLPEPLGHGRVPASILGQFSTVIWLGNNYYGDLGAWLTTSILKYLQAGGNLILITRRGQDFINDELREYLGISWEEETFNTINNCISTYSGLSNMALIGNQSSNAVFNTNISNNESTLLFNETASFSVPRGLGVWRKPVAGGTHRVDGAQFVFISGRPYRYNSNAMRYNIEYMLEEFFLETEVANSNPPPIMFGLYQNYPNPFNPVTTISFQLPNRSFVSLKVYDVLGNEVKTLIEKEKSAGQYEIEFDGNELTSGIYFYQLIAGDYTETKKMVLLK
jgi:hypothetical protein